MICKHNISYVTAIYNCVQFIGYHKHEQVNFGLEREGIIGQSENIS
jgi:hypothetical protein